MANLEKWEKKESIAASKLNQTIDLLNKMNELQNGSMPLYELGGPVRGQFSFRAWVGVIVKMGLDIDTTPNSDDDQNFINHRYWVQKKQAVNIEGDEDPIVNQAIDLENDTLPENLVYEGSLGANGIVCVTNLSELTLATHTLQEGDTVHFLEIESVGGDSDVMYFMSEAPQIAYGKLTADWVDGSNTVEVIVCASATSGTKRYTSPEAELPNVTVRLFAPSTATPHGVMLSQNNIIAFRYEGDATHGYALPVLKGIQVEACEVDGGGFASVPRKIDNLQFDESFLASHSAGKTTVSITTEDTATVTVTPPAACGGKWKWDVDVQEIEDTIKPNLNLLPDCPNDGKTYYLRCKDGVVSWVEAYECTE